MTALKLKALPASNPRVRGRAKDSKTKSQKEEQSFKAPPLMKPGRDYMLNLPKGYLSNSQIELYLRCPAQYEFKYVQGQRQAEKFYFLEGNAIGKAMETTCNAFMDTGVHLTLKQAISVQRSFVAKGAKDVEDWEEHSPSDLKARGKTMLTNFWESGYLPKLRPVERDGRSGAEHKLVGKIAGVPFLGFIDLLEETVVTDFKVSNNPRKRYNAQKSLQLALYGMMTKMNKARYLTWSRKTCLFDEIGPVSLPLAKTKKWVDRVVSNVAYGISKGSFPVTNPSADYLCDERWCSYWGKCYGASK